MFPRYRRAVRNFADQFFEVMRRQGFEILEILPLREADPDYLQLVRPKLRQEARGRNDEILRLLDLVILARRSL